MAKTGKKRKKHTLESSAKMSKVRTGKKHTLESRAKMSMAQTGKKRKNTLESLAKTSRAHTKKGRVKKYFIVIIEWLCLKTFMSVNCLYS